MIDCLKGRRIDRVPNCEVLIEDRRAEKLLGRKAGNTLGIGGDPAKGSEAAEGVRPMYPKDYLKVCRLLGQDTRLGIGIVTRTGHLLSNLPPKGFFVITVVPAPAPSLA